MPKLTRSKSRKRMSASEAASEARRKEIFATEKKLCAEIVAKSEEHKRLLRRADALDELAEDAERAIPPCLAGMGCLCAGHARGDDASAPCDTREEPAGPSPARVAAGRRRVQDAINTLVSSKELLDGACRELSRVTGASPHYRKIALLSREISDLAHASNNDLDCLPDDTFALDHEPGLNEMTCRYVVGNTNEEGGRSPEIDALDLIRYFSPGQLQIGAARIRALGVGKRVNIASHYVERVS